MADVNDMENWAGPFRNREAAVEGIKLLCGVDYDAALWPKSDGYWINDGTNPDTGDTWSTLPEGAEWIRITAST
jgi:hypothetical protein